MSAACLPLPLDPARTDADWEDDFTFFVDDETTPEDWAGSTATLALVPVDPVLRGLASFMLTSADDALAILSNGVGIRVPAAAMSDRIPAAYDFELRQHRDGATRAVLLGRVNIERGLSEIVQGEPVVGSLSLSGGRGGVKVIRSASGVRIVRAGGVEGPPGQDGDPGPPGPRGTIVSPTEPALGPGEQVLWIQSGLGPEGDQFDIRIATGE